ncbi:AI-2E family transporter [Agromyces seonyuensis]|uniref:AI-2E family transporter n=1 Tax=Agromyces seonyuensis TaxID=2662446 RepID=A0A6I4NUM0_9MICO|nr:AI-2E family transporter [Agromyces seonyuensis]MWB97923.1 AI-2E family transporter [Agromyces seonyuensis]
MWGKRARQKPKAAPEANPDGPSVEGPPTSHRTAFILLGLGGAAVASFGVAAIAEIFASAFFALVLTICVHPIRTALERRGVPRGVATVSVLLAVVLLLFGFGALLFVSIAQFGTLLPDYLPQLEAWVANLGTWLEGLGIGAEQVQSILGGFDPGTLIGFFGGVLGSAAGLISAAVILLTLLILMAADSGYSSTILAELRPRRPILVGALVGFTVGVRRYMVVTTALGAAQGIVNWAALALMGIPGALLWGMLSFLCSFIPNIGYFIALVPPIVFGALVGGWPLVIAVIVVYGVINGVIQSVIQPRVVGNAVSLSQTLTFISVLFWAVVLGPIGAILAIPLTLMVRMLLVDSNPQLAWIRPALGDLDSTRRIMDAEDEAAKIARRGRKQAAVSARRSPPPGSSAPGGPAAGG